MKNIIIEIMSILIICSISNQIIGQSVNLESTIKVSETETLLSVQRIEVKNSIFTLKYDYKANDDDVLGIIVPKIWSNSTNSLGGLVLKKDDGKSDHQFIFDAWYDKKFDKLAVKLEIGHVISQNGQPWDFAGTRISSNNFTIEAYVMAKYTVGEKPTGNNTYFGWIAYHPKHIFVSLGKQDKAYWAYAGTKELSHFGNFTLVNYQPQTKNFWFKSQTAFGRINQKFFCQENYIVAASYLTIPVFYYLHFSPIITKGSLTLKMEGRRTGDIQNYEIMIGKQLGNDLFGFAVGINSEYDNMEFASSPSFELYKCWNNSIGQCVVEFRYDHLHKILGIFLAIKC